MRTVLWAVIPATSVAGFMAFIALDHDPMGEYSGSPENLVLLSGTWFLFAAAVSFIVRLVVIKLVRSLIG